MDLIDSRLPGLHQLSLEQRRMLVATRAGIDPGRAADVCEVGGLPIAYAERMIENAIGIFSLPLGIAPNMRVNGRDVLVPMVTEEPSVVAAVGQAGKWAKSGGGFHTTVMPARTHAQLLYAHVPAREAAMHTLRLAADEILALADAAVPNLVARGGGARSMHLRSLAAPCRDGLAVHVLIDCVDAMGANLANTVAEALRARVSELVGAPARLAILSNLADERRVEARARIPVGVWGDADTHGRDVAHGVMEASELAEADVYRAVTHNKGIMNGMGAVAVATGNDWRALEAGAHGFAALSGRYKPLATWRIEGDELIGVLDVPLAVGTVGGVTAVHEGVKLALDVLAKPNAAELASVMASVGLASNLAALVALTTVGIQAGHMRLHARKSQRPPTP